MANELAVLKDVQLPAHLSTEEAGEHLRESLKAAAGIKSIAFPTISIKGSKFHVKKDGETRLITDPSKPGLNLPLMMLEVVVVGWNPNLSKTFYEGEYDEQKHGEEPDCRSDDSITPDSDIAQPQNNVCSTCKQNQWGSKVSKITGKDVKACSDGKRIVVIPALALEKSEAYGLMITPASLKAWKKYVDILSEKKIPIFSVVTNFTFDSKAAFPKVDFGFNRFLDSEEYALVVKRRASDEVKNIATPRPVSTVRTVAGPAPLNKTEALAPAPVVEKAPVVATKATEAPTTTVKTEQAGFDFGAPAKAAAPAVQPETEAQAQARYAQEVEAKIAHMDESIKATIRVVGIDSPAGQALLAQFPPKLAEAAPKRATRGKAKPAGDPATTTATKTDAPAQAEGFSAAPAANVATAATLDTGLQGMLDDAMKM